MNNNYIELEKDGFLFAREQGNDTVFVFKKDDEEEVRFLCFTNLNGQTEDELIKQHEQAVKSFFKNKDKLNHEGHSFHDLIKEMDNKGVIV